MPFQLPPLPSFQIQPPDVFGGAAKMLQLRSLLGQQQMQPLEMQLKQQEVQQGGIETQLKQMQLDSTKALMDAIKSGAFNKYSGVETPDGTGFNSAGLYQDLINRGVMPAQASEQVNSILGIAQKQAEIRKTQGQAGEAELNIRSKTLDAVGQKLGSITEKTDPVAAAQALDAFKQDLVRNPKAYPGLTQLEMAHLYGADMSHLDAVSGLMGVEGKIADFHKTKAQAAQADTAAQVEQQKLIPPGQAMSPEMKGQAAKDVAVAKATQPLKIETAITEAKTKQLMEGLTKPGYAFDPATGATKLTDQTAYLQSGGALQAFRPVTEKDVKDDTMLINRLGDVHQKIAEYEQALQKPISATEQRDIAALLGTTPSKLGVHGPGGILGGVNLEVPMERIDAALNKENLKALGPEAREQLVAYRNAREAMLGYKTVLSGSARGSDKSMDLLVQALPDPSITDADFSKRSLDAFKQNLHIVGQGLPELPGLKSPKQIEADVWGGGAALSVKAPNGKTYNFKDAASRDAFKKAAGIP